MAALIKSLDNYTPTQFGENGHVEYGWSNNIQEQILQFSFQITRTNRDGVNKLEIILNNILSNLKLKVENGTLPEKEVAKGYLSMLYRMIGHTRDIIDGKGEYSLAYMMIYTWHKYYSELSKFALKFFIDLGDKNVHQYGSWKDIKYFCEYCRDKGENEDFSLIKYAITLMNDQIRCDYTNYISIDNTMQVSLAAKWAPREKSSFGWLYQYLATNYFSEFMVTADTVERRFKAILKCKTEYRKILSALNRHIDTLQIKQCGKNWEYIDFTNVTSISLSKQKKAFLNIKKNGEVRYPENEDRIVCANHFNQHVQRAVKGEIEMKGKRVGMSDFTKQAIQLLREEGSQTEKDLLNSQWRDNASQSGSLGKMIAMVDVSRSMNGDPMNVAIALGIRIAEKSVIGNRVMTFSAQPTWVNLETSPDFISKVDAIYNAEWGMNTNFHAALDMILDAIIQNKMEAQDVQDMVLVILSDMQIDYGDNCNKESLYESMKTKYANAGVRVCGVPYKPPHILFWNLRSTSGFPSLSNQPNASMMSGFSPSLLNLFCDEGINALQSCTPWVLLNKSLDNERYKIMGDLFDSQTLV
jgi:hypothetical protein